MRATDILYEDSRTKIEKLEELINHPGTEDTVRSVALSRLKILQNNATVVVEKPRIRVNVGVNVEEADLATNFVPGITLGQLYEGLCSLNPQPNQIRFLRQGQIQMMVPPPFMGKTKPQYIQEINQVCVGARAIDGKMVEGHGYMFTISYI